MIAQFSSRSLYMHNHILIFNQITATQAQMETFHYKFRTQKYPTSKSKTQKLKKGDENSKNTQ